MVDWDWERVVFDHVNDGRDAAASVAFYKTVLDRCDPAALGERARAQFANLVVVAATSGRPDPHGFVARRGRSTPSTRRVDAGYRDNGRRRAEQYSSDEAAYYAAFLLDPDGNNVEAVVREF